MWFTIFIFTHTVIAYILLLKLSYLSTVQVKLYSNEL